MQAVAGKRRHPRALDPVGTRTQRTNIKAQQRYRRGCAPACTGLAASALLAEAGGFQVQAALQLLAGGLADGAVV